MEDSHQIISFPIASNYTMALDKEIQINLSLRLEEAYYNCTFSGHTVVTCGHKKELFFILLIKKIPTFPTYIDGTSELTWHAPLYHWNILNTSFTAKYVILLLKRVAKLKSNKYNTGETVTIQDTNESVTINKWAYVKNMKRYSYTVKEHPTTFFFEEELKKA
ncbi:hypothetical protein FOA20_07810 [Peribacillus simplex]